MRQQRTYTTRSVHLLRHDELTVPSTVLLHCPVTSVHLLITPQIGLVIRQEVLIPINQNRYNFRKQQHLGHRSPVETIFKLRKNSSFWKFLNSFRISDCFYCYCDLFCDWWIWLSGLSMIGCFNCPITANCPKTADYS